MSYTPEQPDPLVFFIDRSLGKKTIADALKHEGAEVYVHDDLFPADSRYGMAAKAADGSNQPTTQNASSRQHPLEAQLSEGL